MPVVLPQIRSTLDLSQVGLPSQGSRVELPRGRVATNEELDRAAKQLKLSTRSRILNLCLKAGGSAFLVGIPRMPFSRVTNPWHDSLPPFLEAYANDFLFPVHQGALLLGVAYALHAFIWAQRAEATKAPGLNDSPSQPDPALLDPKWVACSSVGLATAGGIGYEFWQYLSHEGGYCPGDYAAIALGATIAIPVVVGLSRRLRSEGRDLAGAFRALRAIREIRRESRRAVAHSRAVRAQVSPE